MSVADLTKYQPAISRKRHDEDDDEAVMRVADSGYVKFEEAMEASSNSLHQLQDKIAALVSELWTSYEIRDDKTVVDCLKQMRQLSQHKA
jgi:hypothetical protein